VALIPQHLHLLIVGVLVRNEIGGPPRATIWIGSIFREEPVSVDVHVVRVDGVVKSNDDHLRRLFA